MPTVPNLSPNQILALVVLMSEARELNNSELKELAGFSLTGADNAKLEKKLGLVATDRSHRPFSHQLTDAGWAVVRELHTMDLSKQRGSSSRTMLTLLGNINRAVDQLQATHGVSISLGEFFRQLPASEGAAGAVDPVAMVRAAYASLVARPGEWVGLADLRDKLPDLSRGEVDEALRGLLDEDGVRIIPVANTKALKERDRAAAISIGGEDSHQLSIGRP
ncbi:hypothetical protein ACFFX1_34000 [Dactylosporangium sucinum]|uniref:Uncharacterized protein n=1 Tax=Dactylosporangium sucinum TaxID=1424081 RepID=A0A917UD74_9ACTN|nr:hypothetical protein [Dactylosporangium sucinum]GGM80393.1 hypothetical protein GCM10007977_097340 [Dactylosporangium sucinum]